MKTSELSIGWASRDVTPYGRKVDLAGQFRHRITDQVNDPVTTTVLTLASEDAANSVIFVSCDLCGIPATLIEECRDKVAALDGSIPVDAFVFNATHTHAGPGFRGGLRNYDALPEELKKEFMDADEFRGFLSDKIAEAVVESWTKRASGQVAWGLGQAVVGHNRRAVYLEDFEKVDHPGRKIEKNARMYGKTNDPNFSHIEGFEDHSVRFLFTFDADGELTGSIINVPCPSQCTEQWDKISADYWHETRELLRETYGKNLFVLPQCSAAGDQSPHLLLNKRAASRMLALREGVPEEELDFNVSQRREIARRIKTAFNDALAWAEKDKRSKVELKHSSKIIQLPRRMVTKEEAAKNHRWIEELQHQEGPNQERLILRCEQVIARFEDQKRQPTLPFQIHVVRVGDVVFATNQFELFMDYGVRMQARSPAKQTFVVQLAGSLVPPVGDDHTIFPRRGGTYLPTVRAEAGGSYSACLYCNQIGSDGGQALVEETLTEINGLFPSQSSG